MVVVYCPAAGMGLGPPRTLLILPSAQLVVALYPAATDKGVRLTILGTLYHFGTEADVICGRRCAFVSVSAGSDYCRSPELRNGEIGGKDSLTPKNVFVILGMKLL